MSNWIEITDPEDIDVTASVVHEDNEVVGTKHDVDILYSSDGFGNNYISVPLEMLLKRLRDLKVIPEDR